jgi:hypothetical protein
VGDPVVISERFEADPAANTVTFGSVAAAVEARTRRPSSPGFPPGRSPVPSR